MFIKRFVVLGAITTISAAAWAISPHFLSADGTVNSAGALIVDFKEAGLGDTTVVDYLLSTTASATYQCFNNGSNAPQGVPFVIPDQSLTATGRFASTKNGNIIGELVAGPPDPAPAAAVSKCLDQGNKKLCLLQVSYSATTLTDTTFNVSTVITPTPTERSFPTPSKQNPNPGNCITSL